MLCQLRILKLNAMVVSECLQQCSKATQCKAVHT
jgi:hypothetical protein